MTTGRFVERIVRGGPALEGEAVQFELQFEDGTIDHLQCGAEKLPKLVHALKQFGEMAEHLRSKNPGPAIEVVSPYLVEDVKIGKSLDGSQLVLGIRTGEGIPLNLSMSLAVAVKLAQIVRSALNRNHPPAKPS